MSTTCGVRRCQHRTPIELRQGPVFTTARVATLLAKANTKKSVRVPQQRWLHWTRKGVGAGL